MRTRRGRPKSPRLTEDEAATIKGMLRRGDRQQDIAAYYNVNSGRIAEISTGAKFADVLEASSYLLPPPGPYYHPSQMTLLHRANMAKGERFVTLLLASCLEEKDALPYLR